MINEDAARALEDICGSRMITADDGSVSFTMPTEALRQTVMGNPMLYMWASTMMRIAAGEVDAVQGEKEFMEKCRKAEQQWRTLNG